MEVRRNARMVAVQAIFQYFFNKQEIFSVLDQFSDVKIGNYGNNKLYDKKFFRVIVIGVDENKNDIKALIEKNLSENWVYERLDITLKAILSLGVYELQNCKEIPLKVIINEYVTISKMFFNNDNTGFINGVLDNIGKKVRVDE